MMPAGALVENPLDLLSAVALSVFTVAAVQTPPKVKVCELLPKAEVKRLIGAPAAFDAVPPAETELGSYGSTCTYAGVMIQIVPFQQISIDAAKKRGNLSTIAGVGDGAWLYSDPGGYAELYVRAGRRLLVIQRKLEPGIRVADVRPGMIALAKVLVGKLAPRYLSGRMNVILNPSGSVRLNARKPQSSRGSPSSVPPREVMAVA
jgi:hypothetical protein